MAGFPVLSLTSSVRLIQLLPADGYEGALAGRIWLPGVGPSVVALRKEGVFDISSQFPTMSTLAAASDPAQAVRSIKGDHVGSLEDFAANTPSDARNSEKPWLLS